MTPSFAAPASWALPALCDPPPPPARGAAVALAAPPAAAAQDGTPDGAVRGGGDASAVHAAVDDGAPVVVAHGDDVVVDVPGGDLVLGGDAHRDVVVVVAAGDAHRAVAVDGDVHVDAAHGAVDVDDAQQQPQPDGDVPPFRPPAVDVDDDDNANVHHHHCYHPVLHLPLLLHPLHSVHHYSVVAVVVDLHRQGPCQ